jgi:beta-carotene 3-hydroxylase
VTSLIVALAVWLGMEPLTYLAHRRLMHGRRGYGWHRSHHAPGAHRFEGNDLFPLVFAAATVGVMAVGTWVDGLPVLVPVTVGVTLYGFSYLLVHDVFIHRRIPLLPRHLGPVDRLREAHRIHHLYGGEPYGFLFPLVPKGLRERAARTTFDPLEDRAEREVSERQPSAP